MRISPLVRTNRSSSGKVSRVQLVRNPVFGQLVRRITFVNQPAHRRAGRINDLGASAIVQGDRQNHAGILSGSLRRSGYFAPHTFRQRARAANGLKLDVLPVDLVQLEPQDSGATCASTHRLRNAAASNSQSRTRKESARPDQAARPYRQRHEQLRRPRGARRCAVVRAARPSDRCHP